MTVFVVDVSHYQAGLSMQSLKDQGFAAVILKVTEGLTYRDSSFAGWLAECRKIGLPVAAYHFLHPSSLVEQARITATLVPADVPVWVDAEAGSTVAQAVTYGNALRALGRQVAGIYSGAHPPTGYGGWWHADYVTDPVDTAAGAYARLGGDTGRGWRTSAPAPDLWQFCQHGRVSGYSGDVDFSAYRGTVAQLLSHGWFLARAIDPITISREASMILVNVNVSATDHRIYLVWGGDSGIRFQRLDKTGVPLAAAGMQSITLGTADFTALTKVEAFDTPPAVTIDTSALASTLAPLLAKFLPTSLVDPVVLAGELAPLLAGDLAARLAQ